MVTLDWSLERSDGVTLVGLVVAAERPCRVRIENRLDGPVWPPRRRGQPADGWEGDVFTGEVSAEGRLTVGYATPASPAEPPAEVVATEPATGLDEERGDEAARASPVPAVDSTPAGVVRALGDPVVPRDSVPVPETPCTGSDSPPAIEPDGERSDSQVADHDRVGEADRTDTSAGSECQTPVHSDEMGPSDGIERLVVPSGVRSWLRDVEARLEAGHDAGERERAAELAPQTTESALASARAADRQALRRVRRRADELLARADRSGHRSPQSESERERTAASDGGAVGR